MARLEVESREQQQKGAFDIPATEIGLEYGQINSPARDAFWQVNQNLGSIPAHLQRAKLNKQHVALARQQQRLTEKDIIYQVRLAWQQWLYLRQVTRELNQQLAFYEDFERRTSLQFSVGESSLLEKTRSEEHTSELQSRENLVCRLLLEKKKKIKKSQKTNHIIMNKRIKSNEKKQKEVQKF